MENTCDKTTLCTNIDGGYECRCSPGGSCSQHCFVNGKKKKHGSSWDGEACETCSCLVSVYPRVYTLKSERSTTQEDPAHNIALSTARRRSMGLVGMVKPVKHAHVW